MRLAGIPAAEPLAESLLKDVDIVRDGVHETRGGCGATGYSGLTCGSAARTPLMYGNSVS
jgi:hypothetical protein